MASSTITVPAYRELESWIDECMLVDRFRMRRDIKKKNERGKLFKAIKKSRGLVERRQSKVPEVTYPEALPVSGRVDDIRAAMESHQVVIVAGETGSGKTLAYTIPMIRNVTADCQLHRPRQRTGSCNLRQTAIRHIRVQPKRQIARSHW